MATKGVPHPHEFFAECLLRCGTYRIGEKTARRFLTRQLLEKLDDRLRKGAAGAKLSFKKGCPVCEPNSTHEIELIALRARVH